MKRLLLWSVCFISFQSYASQGLPIGSVVIQRDPKAISALNAALLGFGPKLPVDSVAQASIILANGDSGTLTIKTLGRDSHSEDVITNNGEEVSIYVAGESNRRHNQNVDSQPLEAATSDASCIFPLPELFTAANNSDEALQYIGLEDTSFHLRFWNTFSSLPRLVQLAPFTRRDLWIDSSTGLPSKLTFDQRSAQGAVPSTAIEFDFSNYQAVGAVKYPFTIVKYVNGVLWGTIQIQSVQFNVGLSTADFPIQ
jgi:hypothetical protein